MAGPWVRVPARRRRAHGGPGASTALPPIPRRGNERAGPEELEGCWQLDVRLGGDLVFVRTEQAAGRGGGGGGRWEFCPQLGSPPAALTFRTEGEAGKY